MDASDTCCDAAQYPSHGSRRSALKPSWHSEQRPPLGTRHVPRPGAPVSVPVDWTELRANEPTGLLSSNSVAETEGSTAIYTRLMAKPDAVGFIEPMLLLKTETLPDDPTRWAYELKLDGYRAIAFKKAGKVHLRSRNDNDFSGRYASLLRGLAKLPNDTVIDGEVVAFDEAGRPSFNALQNYDGNARIVFYVFDVLSLAGRDVDSFGS
jgi:hypothetical protein